MFPGASLRSREALEFFPEHPKRDQTMPCVELDVRNVQRARVWLDELPNDAMLFHEARYNDHSFAECAAVVSRKRVAIEVFQPFGASFHYGLLGGEYEHTGATGLKVMVPVDGSFPRRRFMGSLARSLDVVSVGGLAEYESAICSGVKQIRVNARPCGTLKLLCMAHGEIGSSPFVFSSLARAVVKALGQPVPTSFEDVRALLAA